jgi:hypothetical protein
MINRLLPCFLACGLATAAIACTVTSTSPDTGSSTGATSGQVSECHSGCDQAKFFNCSTAADLATCYDDCGSALPAKIDEFNACSNTSICDPSCRGIIDPAPAAGVDAGSGGGGGVAASDCGTACMKLIMCSFIPVGSQTDCVNACQQQGYQYQIDCINNNACTDIKARCGTTSSGGSGTDGGTTDVGTTDPNVAHCQADCQALQVQDCLTATELTTCNAACTTNTGTPRSTFESCEEESSVCTTGHDCFAAFAGN